MSGIDRLDYMHIFTDIIFTEASGIYFQIYVFWFSADISGVCSQAAVIHWLYWVKDYSTEKVQDVLLLISCGGWTNKGSWIVIVEPLMLFLARIYMSHAYRIKECNYDFFCQDLPILGSALAVPNLVFVFTNFMKL